MKIIKNKLAHLKLGKYGEKLACELVSESGGIVLCSNYRVVSGEIDIVAWDNGILCFIEVKTRKNDGIHDSYLNHPADAVGYYKRQRLRRAIRSYLRNCDEKKIKYRADVVEIVLRNYWVVI
ncbi:MAG: YraN family protein, partial [Lentisphaeria bacterium]